MRNIRWTKVFLPLMLAMLILPGCGGGDDAGEGGDGDQSAAQDGDIGGGDTANATTTPKGNPIAVFKTNKGEIRVELLKEKAPRTVDGFTRLVRMGHYDGTIIHQIAGGEMILGGRYKLGASGDYEPVPSSTTYPCEADNGLPNKRGTIAVNRMATLKDSGGPEYFFNVVDNPDLDHKGESDEEFGYCVFGQVLKDGIGVLDDIAKAPVEDRPNFAMTPATPIVIESVTLQE